MPFLYFSFSSFFLIFFFLSSSSSFLFIRHLFLILANDSVSFSFFFFFFFLLLLLRLLSPRDSRSLLLGTLDSVLFQLQLPTQSSIVFRVMSANPRKYYVLLYTLSHPIFKYNKRGPFCEGVAIYGILCKFYSREILLSLRRRLYCLARIWGFCSVLTCDPLPVQSPPRYHGRFSSYPHS